MEINKINPNARKYSRVAYNQFEFCKFTCVRLTRFRLVEKQSATVRTHTCALSWTSPFKSICISVPQWRRQTSDVGNLPSKPRKKVPTTKKEPENSRGLSQVFKLKSSYFQVFFVSCCNARLKTRKLTLMYVLL